MKAIRGVSVGVVGAMVAVSTAGCVDLESPTAPSRLTPTQSTTIRPSTTATEVVTLEFIDATNRGDRNRVLELSCGVIHEQVSRMTDQEFRDAQRVTHGERGDGAVRGMTDYTQSNGGTAVTARVLVRYDKHAAGMDADNNVTYLGRWEKSDGKWRICDFLGET